MTEAYQQFKEAVEMFINNPSKDHAKQFTEFIDVFWFQHELDLFYGSKQNLNDEYTIVDNVMELCDRFDECDAIVEHDPYCIDAKQLYNSILDT